MAERPTIPRISDISAPLFSDPTVRDRVGRTATAVNLATEFANASGAFREGSPDLVQNTTSLDGLIAGAPVLVDTAEVAVESPGVVPAYADGGYPFIDEMLHAKPVVGESTSTASARLARAINSRYELVSTRTGNTIRYATPANGFTKLEIRASNNRYTSLRTDPIYGLPVFPNTLNSRIRCIVGHSTSIDPSIALLGYSDTGRLRGRVHCTVWPQYTGGTGRAIWPNFQYSERGFTSGIGGLSLFGTSGVLVFEMSIYPVGGDRTGSGFGSNVDHVDAMRFTLGHYDNIEQAFADGGAGGAFASLEPGHPNYLGRGSGVGNIPFRSFGSTNRYFPGYHRYAINVGDWYYIETLVGDVKNDVMNRLVGIPPDREGIDDATIAEQGNG